MAIIKFVKPYPDIVVDPGANLMQSLLKGNMPVASSCHGDGICSKCAVRIVNGAENLNKMKDSEAQLLEKNGFPTPYRLSCQTIVLGDITLDTTYW